MDFMTQLATLFASIGYSLISLFGGTPTPPASNILFGSGATSTASVVSASTSITAATTGSVHAYTQAELLAMAGDLYANGSVPLGDYKYVTTGAKKGYIYLCNVHKDNPGSMVNGPWITGTTWNFLKKVTVDGAITWKQATFSNIIAGTMRVLTGNDLPVGQTTGVFPVASTDDAHQYDPNPNTISVQSLKDSLPANPTYSATPYCMGGEVGVMTNGVALFDGFDAGLRDAPAHEVQDSNDGHPQGSGEYHYHSLPAFDHDALVSTVIGFAYDGFPITGPVVASGKYLTTDNLDECHGLTSTITLDGKQVTTYHYVMTYDFPYSASCFRGKPISTGPSGGTHASTATSGSGTSSGGGVSTAGAPQGGTPPAAALSACSGKTTNASCSFTAPQGTITGTCKNPPGASLACVPQ